MQYKGTTIRQQYQGKQNKQNKQIIELIDYVPCVHQLLIYTLYVVTQAQFCSLLSSFLHVVCFPSRPALLFFVPRESV